MNYSDMTTNGQRLHIAANGFQQTVTLDYYDVRAAMEMEDIAQHACRFSDPAKSTLRFAVFLKAAKMTYLKPQHLLEWISRRFGADAIADYAQSKLGMVKRA